MHLTYSFHYVYAKSYLLVDTTVADWNSVCRVITQKHNGVFQTLGPDFRIPGKAFGFLVDLNKLGRVFQKLG